MARRFGSWFARVAAVLLFAAGLGVANPLLPPAAATVPPPVVPLSIGDIHSCALTAAGGVMCWGSNASGQLGDGTTTNRSTPVDVSGLTSGVSAIGAGFSHSCALTSTGGAKCWGTNTNGALGDGTTTQRLTPVDVSGLTSGMTAIDAGLLFTCALTSTGGVKCWGSNSVGQLGDTTTTNRSTPVDVSGLTSGVSAISAGSNHACALTEAGGVKCWGYNAFGQLGDGTTTNRSTPVDVSGLTSGVTAIAAAGQHSCALTTAGGVKCWGDNTYDQLGDGTTTSRSTPGDVSGLTSGVTAIAADRINSCALTSAGGVKCWGNNDEAGELGNGTDASRSTPDDVVGLTSGATAIAVGGSHACALTSAGAVKCWGANSAGDLGNGTTGDYRTTPVDVWGLTSGVTATATGGNYACALTSAGGVKCWGRNDSGQLGDGTTTDRRLAVGVSGLTSGVSAIATGGDYTCALTSTGGVECWGDNGNGQLGDGTTTNRSTPVDVSGLTSGVTAIAAGGDHACALTGTGFVKCWGENGNGQLGDGANFEILGPVSVGVPPISNVSAISAGGSSACALTSGGGVKCWGMNFSGQLGDGTTTDRWIPVDVIGLGSGGGQTPAAAISAGGSSSCALTSAGGAKCWGQNNSGQLGDGTTTQRLTPVDVSGLSGGEAIAAGGSSCALTSAGGVKCWGQNNLGQLGDGTTTQRLTPVDVSGLTSGTTAIAAHGSCALTSAGGVKCWGPNTYAQLGDGTRWTPVDVIGNFYATAPASPTVSIVAHEQGLEGNAGTNTITFAVTLSQAMPSKVTVQYAVTGTTATAASQPVPGADVEMKTGTVTFAPNATTGLTPTSKNIAVKIFSDTTVENDETFAVTLSNPAGGVVLGSPIVGTGTILNDDGPISGVTLSVGNHSIYEGDSGTHTLTFPVTLSRPVTSTVSVQYTVFGDTDPAYSASGGTTPGSGVDFKVRSGTLTFTPSAGTGVTPISNKISVTVYGDTTVENDETFAVVLTGPSDPNVTLGAHSTAVGTIRNDDTGSPQGITAGIGDATIVEAAAGSQNLAFAITLSSKAATTVTFTYTITPGTANYSASSSGGGDFGGHTTGTLTFNVGASGFTANVKTLSIPIWPHVNAQTGGTFTVTLSNITISAVNLIDDTATGTILVNQ